MSRRKALDNRNYIMSEAPFPTYVFENESLFYEEDSEIERLVQDAYDKANTLVDEANEEIRDYANSVASEIETKRNTDDLDLARDLFTIYLKDGYRYGFSMILDFDDLYMESVTREQREKLENLIKSFALSLMKNIANEVGMSKIGGKASDEDQPAVANEKELKDKIKKIDLDLTESEDKNDQTTWIKLMNERNDLTRQLIKLQKEQRNKSQDSADLKVEIEVNGILANALVQDISYNGKDLIFKYEGKDITITCEIPPYYIFEDYNEEEYDIDELVKRMQEGDLRDQVIEELENCEATLLIWL